MNGRQPELAGLTIREEAKAGRQRRVWPLSVAGGAIVLVVAVLVALGGRGRPGVRVVEARGLPAAGARVVLNASGYVTPRRRATVAAKITGRVTEVLVEEGMHVAAGQVLARLDDADARRRLEAARAGLDVARAALPVLEVNLHNAEREVARIGALAREGIDSDRALDAARTAAEALRAQLEAARREVAAAEASVRVALQEVENCTVRAPFAGVAVSRDAQVGEMVSPISAGGGFTRTGIATIVDMTSLEIEVDVNESNLARVRPEQPVRAVLDAYPEWQIPGSVRTVIPTADRQKATVKVRIAFDALDPRILPDMGVKVAFLAEGAGEGEPQGESCLVPMEAVDNTNGQPAVFVVVGDRVERRAVAVGSVRGSEVGLLSGVTAGERVVVGPRGLVDGQRVRVAP